MSLKILFCYVRENGIFREAQLTKSPKYGSNIPEVQKNPW